VGCYLSGVLCNERNATDQVFVGDDEEMDVKEVFNSISSKPLKLFGILTGFYIIFITHSPVLGSLVVLMWISFIGMEVTRSAQTSKQLHADSNMSKVFDQATEANYAAYNMVSATIPTIQVIILILAVILAVA
jgi:hypothetical protein